MEDGDLEKKPKIAERMQKPTPNLFHVQWMRVGEETYITFNYHPFLTKQEALYLAIWLIFFADWQWGKKHFSRAIAMLKAMIPYAIQQQEDTEQE